MGGGNRIYPDPLPRHRLPGPALGLPDGYTVSDPGRAGGPDRPWSEHQGSASRWLSSPFWCRSRPRRWGSPFLAGAAVIPSLERDGWKGLFNCKLLAPLLVFLVWWAGWGRLTVTEPDQSPPRPGLRGGVGQVGGDGIDPDSPHRFSGRGRAGLGRFGGTFRRGLVQPDSPKTAAAAVARRAGGQARLHRS